ncbi:MAG: hypothetical protein ACR2OE_14975 [Thermomicrobiales bacterium]
MSEEQTKRASELVAHILALKTLTDKGVRPTMTLATLFVMAAEYRDEFGLVEQDESDPIDSDFYATLDNDGNIHIKEIKRI